MAVKLKSVTWSTLKDGTAQLCRLSTSGWTLQLSFSQLWDGMMGQKPINEGRQMASKITVVKIGQYTVFPGKQTHCKCYRFRLEQDWFIFLWNLICGHFSLCADAFLFCDHPKLFSNDWSVHWCLWSPKVLFHMLICTLMPFCSSLWSPQLWA